MSRPNSVGLSTYGVYYTSKNVQHLDVHLIPAFGKRQLCELTREELQSFLSRKLSSGLSCETVHHFKCGLSKILGAAEEWGCIAENITQKTKLPRRHHGPERAVLTPVQVRNLAAALNEPARSITLLLALTGLRRPADVDSKALVFATREGLPLERWNLLRKHLKPAAKKLGLPGVTWHRLRHSHATMLDSVGTDRNGAIAPRPFHAGDDTRDLFTRDPGRTASCG